MNPDIERAEMLEKAGKYSESLSIYKMLEETSWSQFYAKDIYRLENKISDGYRQDQPKEF